MKAKQPEVGPTRNSTHEAAFVIPDQRSRYSEFLPKPERRNEILGRLNHFFDFIHELATQIPRGSAFELAQVLRRRGAGRHGYVLPL